MIFERFELNDDICKFSKFEREVDLNADKKRMWIPAKEMNQ